MPVVPVTNSMSASKYSLLPFSLSSRSSLAMKFSTFSALVNGPASPSQHCAAYQCSDFFLFHAQLPELPLFALPLLQDSWNFTSFARHLDELFSIFAPELIIRLRPLDFTWEELAALSSLAPLILSSWFMDPTLFSASRFETGAPLSLSWSSIESVEAAAGVQPKSNILPESPQCQISCPSA